MLFEREAGKLDRLSNGEEEKRKGDVGGGY